MILVTIITTGLCIAIIYSVIYNEKKEYLKELCVNQMNIIKSIYKETNDEKRIINILKEQNRNRTVLGETGEYIIAILVNDSINFLLDLRRTGYSMVNPIPFYSDTGIPIKYALSKMTGFITGPDYSNTKVLAYCTFIPELNWGLVTKMDMSEVNYPFYKTGLYALIAALVLVLIGTQAFKLTFDPIISRIFDNEKRYRSLFDYSAIPMWEVDFSEVRKHFDKLKKSGITNFQTYLENNGNEIKYLTSLVKITYVNQKSVNFFEVDNKDEIINNLLSYFNEDSIEIFKNELSGLAEGITHFETELPIRTLKGEIKTILFHMSVMPGHEDDLSEVLVSFVDITKRKLAENLLMENAARLNRSQEIAHLGSWELDRVKRLLSWSDEIYRILGYQPGEYNATFEKFLEAIHPDDRDAVTEVINSSIKEGKEGFETEHRIIRKLTGEIRHVTEKCFHHRDKTGTVIRSVGLVHDITDRKIIENTQTFLVKSGWLEKGEDFFQSLARYLAETLQMDYVSISRLPDNEMTSQTIAIYSDGHFKDNYGYSLKDTPSREVVGNTFCYFPRKVRNLFPDDNLLQDIVAESFAGTTLWNSSGKPMGIIALMSRKPLNDNNMIETVLNLVAIRASGEMERKATESALRESEQKLKHHFENSPLAVVEWDTNYFITSWSKEAEHIFGWKAEEVVGKRIDSLNIIYEDDIPIVNNTMERLSGGREETVVSTNRNYTKSGDIIECIWYNSVLLDDKGRMASTMSLVADITERKKAEEALRRSEENIRTILDATQESLIMFDRNGTILTANITASDRFNLSQSDILGHNFSELVSENLAMTRMAYLNEVVITGKPVQFEDVRNDISFEHNFFPVFQDDKIIGVVSFSRDITERKKAEESIRVSEEKFRAIALNTPDHIFIQDADLKYITVINPQLGLEESEMIGKTDVDLLNANDARNLNKIKRKVIESGNAESLMIPLRGRDGNLQFYEGSYIPKRNSQGNADGIIGYFRNVTTRYKMEEDLRMREIKFRNLFENSNDGILIADIETGQYFDCNVMLESMTGYSRSEIFSMKSGALLKTSINMEVTDFEKPEKNKGFRAETEIICKDGKIIPVDFSGFVSEIDNKQCIVTMIRDISARNLAEEALKKSEAQLRELNATKDKFFNIVAHDMKNPFTSLLGSTELLHDNIHKMEPETIRKLAQIMNDSAKSGYAILLNLLDWSRSQTGLIKLNPEKLNLKSLIDKNISEQKLYSSNKQINLYSSDKEDMIVFADKNMINTVLRNLISNGIKFTHKGGKVVVGATITGNEVIISVKDTGIGISEENINKLFRIDTRFQLPGTDKEQGTGLGLKLCKEFIEKLNGKIWVESIENKGSDFKFSIPIQ
jgi:PAS domain S-box-containing protein